MGGNEFCYPSPLPLSFLFFFSLTQHTHKPLSNKATTRERSQVVPEGKGDAGPLTHQRIDTNTDSYFR